MLREFLIALQFLTCVHFVRPPVLEPVRFGRSGVFFPLIGLLLGVAAWSVDSGLRPMLPVSLLSMVLVALLAILGRGLQLRGVAASAVGLLGRKPRAARLAAMQDRPWGVVGIAALAALLVLKVTALACLDTGYRGAAVLLSPMLGRWACVVMAYSSRPARNYGLGAAFMQDLGFREFGTASVMTLVLVLSLVEVGGLLVFLGLAGIMIGWILYCNRRLDGVTGDAIGALGEIVETGAVCLFAVLESVVG